MEWLIDAGIGLACLLLGIVAGYRLHIWYWQHTPAVHHEGECRVSQIGANRWLAEIITDQGVYQEELTGTPEQIREMITPEWIIQRSGLVIRD
jgi:hypothetical protein